MLKVDILTKESCGGIPSYDHFITIVFVSQGGRFQTRVYRSPRLCPPAIYRIIFSTAFTDYLSLFQGLFTRSDFSPCPLLAPLKLRIVPMVMLQIMDRIND